MKAGLAVFLSALGLAGAPAVPAQTDTSPYAGMVFSIRSSQMILRSLDGTALPLQVASGYQHMLVRSRSDPHFDTDEAYPGPDEPAFLRARDDTGFAELSEVGRQRHHVEHGGTLAGARRREPEALARREAVRVIIYKSLTDL